MSHTIEDYNRNNPGKVWRTYRYDLSKSNDIAKYIARTRYAWPGGYELFGIASDSGVICNDCCHSEFYQIANSTPGDGWQLDGIGSTDSVEDYLACDHCSRAIWEDPAPDCHACDKANCDCNFD